jgi:DNA-binding NtrC family response regulator
LILEHLDSGEGEVEIGSVPEIAAVLTFGQTLSAGLANSYRWRGEETILLVEDDAVVRKATAEVLRSAGYQVVIAESSIRALEFYREFSQTVDLLFSDVIMPGINGRELAREFCALSPAIRVLLTSGYSEQLALCELSPYRMEYLAKPYSVNTLLQCVRKVLDENPFDSPLPLN